MERSDIRHNEFSHQVSARGAGAVGADNPGSGNVNVRKIGGKPCYCLGGANTLWDDLGAAKAVFGELPVIACNDAGLHYGGQIEAWVSLETEKLASWVQRRREVGNPPAKRILSHRVGVEVDRTVNWALPGMATVGSSGLLAVAAAVELGYDRIILCGIPMVPDADHFDRVGRWAAAYSYHIGWVQAYPFLRDRVRSMGGWTAQIFGYPTHGWVSE